MQPSTRAPRGAGSCSVMKSLSDVAVVIAGLISDRSAQRTTRRPTSTELVLVLVRDTAC
jgi:hypothetical protein